MMCDDCPRVFHMECLDPPLADVPLGEWSCEFCLTRAPYETRPRRSKRIRNKS